ncbi:AraC family transcriptional regulator [Roseateles chitinivorans]|uniref:helix-turn-helix transcriptional regulator n=1 Tax=Roseateles chitinivorans TaxID=2917965 RepID=UPI003D66FBB7
MADGTDVKGAQEARDGAGWLDRLLALVDVDGRLDIRCDLGAGWSLDQAAKVAEAGHHMPFHVLLDGEALVDAEGLRDAPMHAGDILMLPAGGAHRLRDRDPASLQGPGEGTLLCGRFIVPAASSKLIRALLPPAMVVRSPGPGSRLTRLLALMREEADAPGEGGAALLRHLSGALFAVALRAAMDGNLPATVEAPGVLALGAHPRLAALVVDILGNLAHDWSLDSMAERAALSRSSLIRSFQAAAGVSPAEFLHQVRMTEAARRLRSGRESPAAIGETVGYASEAAFQRAFKREIGVTPAAWRDGVEALQSAPDNVALPVRQRLG